MIARTLDWNAIGEESLTLFRELLALNTTNPPGNEIIATDVLTQSLAKDGIEAWVVESAPGRANLVARLKANVKGSSKGPLLLAGHTDVVPADASQWTHPPFGATQADGFVWGRGALDMKNMVAMSAMIMKLFARMDLPRDRDIIFAAVADEEEGCAYGSKFLVEEHPERVRAEYMLGEVGGFWLHVGDRTYVPIQVAEKGQVHLRLRARGDAGHASMPHKDNSLVRLGDAIARLGRTRLPHHLTPVMKRFIEELSATQPMPDRLALRGLMNPKLAGPILDYALPDKSIARSFGALLHNTVSPTILHAGDKRNTIPAQSVCDLDGRILPGWTEQDLVREVERIVRPAGVEVELVSAFRGVALEQTESPLYDVITKTVERHAPDVQCIPYMVTGYTDAQQFSKLGTKCYGFSPLKITKEDNIVFSELFHGVDERVPVQGYLWGQRALFDVVESFVSGR